MNITVFGSSKPNPGEPLYKQAYELGQALACSHHSVLTGGYIGTMEAVSRGAAEAGGHVIGVTCDEIEKWRTVGANPWVKEERHVPTLHDRVIALIDGCQAAIALPGGIGTLTEIMLMWNRKLITAIPAKPLILLGEGWFSVVQALRNYQAEYFSLADLELIHFARDNDDALAIIHTMQLTLLNTLN